MEALADLAQLSKHRECRCDKPCQTGKMDSKLGKADHQQDNKTEERMYDRYKQTYGKATYKCITQCELLCLFGYLQTH